MGNHYSKFVVGDKPFCLWDKDISARNREYIESIDPQFFMYAAEAHVEALDRDDGDYSRHAALALRLHYGHALETLLSLLGATIQAPDCIFGWMAKYREPQLQLVLERLSNGCSVLSKLRLNPPTWESLSNAIHSFVNFKEDTKARRVRESYARFWRHAAVAYVNRRNQLEFNSIKHGLRARSGGFSLRMRPEKRPGVPNLEAPVETLAYSKYGSCFLVDEAIGSKNFHLVFRHQFVNWNPQSLVSSLELVKFSLGNIVGFLKVLHGAAPGTVEFSWPEDLDAFDLAVQGKPGAEAFSFGPTVRSGNVELFNEQDILDSYREYQWNSGNGVEAQ